MGKSEAVNEIKRLKNCHHEMLREIDALDETEQAELDEVFEMELTNHLLKETLLSYVIVSAVDLNAQQPRFCQRGVDEFVFMHDYKSFLFHPDKLVNGMRGDLYIDRFSPARYTARNMRKWFDVALRAPFDPRYSGCLRNLRGEALRKTL